MAKQKMTYPHWVNYRIKNVSPEYVQEARKKYYSRGGRIEKYDEYREYCKLFGFIPDNPPEGYWESKETWWGKPLGIWLGLTMGWIAFILSIGLPSTQSKGKEW